MTDSPENGQAAAAPPPKLGRCFACGVNVDLAVTFKREEEGPLLHRQGIGSMRDEIVNKRGTVAALCGPVMTTWRYHVAYWVQTPAAFGMRGVIVAVDGGPLEEQPETIKRLELQLAQSVKRPDDFEGEWKVVVSVLTWTGMGVA